MELINSILRQVNKYEDAKTKVKNASEWDVNKIRLPYEDSEGNPHYDGDGNPEEVWDGSRQANFAAGFLNKAQDEVLKKYQEEIRQKSLSLIDDELHAVESWAKWAKNNFLEVPNAT